MAERLTMKQLSDELEALRKRLREMELQLESRIEKGLEDAAEKLKAHIAEVRSEAKNTLLAGAAPVNTAERCRLIAEAAYLRAERRGFSGGDPEQDWLEAEAEVDRTLLHSWPETTPHESVSRKNVRQGGSKRTQPRE